MRTVEPLRFPPPYRAALALSNDLDDLLEPSGWWEFLRFLNTSESTRFGPGLDLEIGDSFWFYSEPPEEQPASYFVGTGTRPSSFAPYIGTLGRAGYLDTLHSYGNFSRHGGFRRELAERGLRVLSEEGFAPTVWTNHGGQHDFQNLVSGCGDLPENPEARGAPTPEYHLDLTRSAGIRYAWVGELTRTPGQERGISLRDWIDSGSPLRREALAHAARGAARRLGYRRVLSGYPNYPVLSNRILRPRRFRDGSTLMSFVRSGDFDRADFSDLAWILRPWFLDALEDSGGASVVFVHWCKHSGRRFEDLDPEAMAALRDLSRRARDGRIWVTTTGRLLAYCEARRAIRPRVRPDGGGIRVELEADPLPDGRSLSREDLAGLAFGVPRGTEPTWWWGGERIEVVRCAGDAGAVWIPRTPLRFPDPPTGKGC